MIARIEDSLYLLIGSKYFTMFDLKASCWQIDLKEEDNQVGNLGLYECNHIKHFRDLWKESSKNSIVVIV